MNSPNLLNCDFTFRQASILELLATGHSRNEIEKILDMQPRIFEKHFLKICEKLFVEERQ